MNPSRESIERFARHVARSRAFDAEQRSNRVVRVPFTYRGRGYVAIRYRGGRVELYRAAGADGIEQWIRYARPSAGALDLLAIECVADRLDDAARYARSLLATDATNVRDVRMADPVGEWSAVLAEVTDPSSGTTRTERASIKLFNVIDRTIPERP